MRTLFTRAAISTVGAFALLTLPPVSAHAATSRPAPVTCHSNDIIEGGPYGTVTIPKGNYCLILRATIDGNVVAQRGAIQLGIDDSTITGSVRSTGITDNGWICGSHIGQNVTIINSENNPDTTFSPGQWDIGFADPNYCGNTQFDPTPGNTISGNLTFNRNDSGAAIANNDIGNRLACAANNPPPTGGNNSASRATGQCAPLAT